MKSKTYNRASNAGYTLVEVAVASTVLMIGVAAACVLNLTMIGQEETHTRITRALNLAENATRLYQLGIETAVPSGSSEATVFSLLPPDPMVTSFTATTQVNTNMAGIGAPQEVSFSLQFNPTSDASVWSAGTWGGRPDASISGNSDVRTIGPLKALRTRFGK